MNRRHFIQCLTAALITPAWAQSTPSRPRRLLLRSSWQTVNIGDIAHTPGILALLEKYLPEVEVQLLPGDVGNGVAELLKRRFPKLKILARKDAEKAFQECDFLLHGSGPSMVAREDVILWRKTGKPYGIYAITVNEGAFKKKKDNSESTLDLLNNAQFVYFRDSVSLEVAKKQGVKCPVMEFAPDAAFATDLRNDTAAQEFLKHNDLTAGKFLCCIPRYRITPYWKIKKNVPFVEKSNARNEAMKEHDHAGLRQAIVDVVRNTDMKVLICPEDSSQMELGKAVLYDPLPDDVKPRVVWRQNYWLTDEALSTYVLSAGLFGNEMHSPIMCIGNGIPAVVCRWAEQTSKGFMWRDIGLGDWLFTLDNEDEIPRIAPTVLAIAKDPAAAKAKAEKARALVQEFQAKTMGVVAQAAQAA